MGFFELFEVILTLDMLYNDMSMSNKPLSIYLVHITLKSIVVWHVPSHKHQDEL